MTRLLVITAHPDDEVLIAGGTLAACAEAGITAGVICLTDGELGPIADPALASRETLGEVRRAELDAACRTLGVEWCECLEGDDGALRWTEGPSIAQQLAQRLERHRPEVVLTFGPDGLYWHDDHIAAFELAREAVRLARYEVCLYRAIWAKDEMTQFALELQQRGLLGDLWGLEPEDFGVEEEDREGELVLDVSRQCARKLAALRCHRTQLERDNVLLELPEDLALRFLGRERFARVEIPDSPPCRSSLLAELGASPARV
ncbi:MAG TPA: PIG-L deacetylase family protein [Solirubrobacteraceae bacterium]|nr:PIG-L deacetylase family protein [Solirubrobacteraceae bacterium]